MSRPRSFEDIMFSVMVRLEERRERRARKYRSTYRKKHLVTYPTESLGIRTRRKGEISMSEAAALLGWSTAAATRAFKRDGVARLRISPGKKSGRYYITEDDLRRAYPEQYARIMREMVEPDLTMLEYA